MANNVTNTAVLQVLSTEDSTQNVLMNRTIQPSMDGLFTGASFYASTPDALIHSIPFPPGVTVVRQFYFRNLALPGGNSIILNGIPTGGANLPLGLIGPGDVWFYWSVTTGAPAVSGLTQGYTQFQYTGGVASIPFEYFIGA